MTRDQRRALPTHFAVTVDLQVDLGGWWWMVVGGGGWMGSWW